MAKRCTPPHTHTWALGSALHALHIRELRGDSREPGTESGAALTTEQSGGEGSPEISCCSR